MINSAAQIRAGAADLDDKISALHQETKETRAEIAKLDDAREGLRRSRERMLDVARIADDAMREIQALEKDRS
jgi:predicted RNase H-like nuclease (RuvC/YqgF family)